MQTRSQQEYMFNDMRLAIIEYKKLVNKINKQIGQFNQNKNRLNSVLVAPCLIRKCHLY